MWGLSLEKRGLEYALKEETDRDFMAAFSVELPLDLTLVLDREHEVSIVTYETVLK
jgi:hypothetical protein